MNESKLDNLLELAVDTPENIREKSEMLSAGYEEKERLWEVIIRYVGDVEGLRSEYGQLTALLGNYAILKVRQDQLSTLASDPRVEYVEKPKRMSFALYNGKQAACITPVQRSPYNLSGRGTVVAVVDSGIDIFHPDFRREDGSTRLIGLWDQTYEGGEPPEGYPLGTFFSQEDINQVLENGSSFPSRDVSGHGTHVTGIAAGNGRASQGEYRGVAYEADILVVKLGGRNQSDFPLTTGFMMGIDFCVREGIRRVQPLALNLSYGNSYGSHDGTSLVETYLDEVSSLGKTTICIGSGNEGNKRRHVAGQLVQGQEYRIEFAVALGEFSLSLAMWKKYPDSFGVTLLSPSGNAIVMTENSAGAFRSVLDQTEILWFFGEPSPYSAAQEIFIEMVPAGDAETVRSGIWKIVLTPVRIVEGRFDIWMPSGSSINNDTGFLVPSPELTLTIPSTASKPITVGAYDSNSESFAPFSGQGLEGYFAGKPDLLAPGVNILSCAPGGGYTEKSGTSMACPFVTGSAALLMQYGIVAGRDPFLYGQKVKAYLWRGARPLTAFGSYPNAETGWGTLCLRMSLPE